MEQDKATAGKELKSIVAAADNTLIGFIELGQSFGLILDYSLDSLDEVEKLLVTFKSRTNFEELKSDAWLYIGQCLCKSLAAKWKVSNDVSHYRHHYMLPVVQGFSKFNDQYCPMLEINKFLVDSKKSFFKNTIHAMQNGTYRYN
ncbi:hypothetical protein [Pedobacter nutrimenti]|uniref:hypothetical protein n=1 Tax=Pedobacter nutrimenti TaxID=1241337 RepID=UPI00293053A1|nr:hypothetical protein [Pedobacter nutrimenti]